MSSGLIRRAMRRAVSLDAREVRFRTHEAVRSVAEAARSARGEHWQHGALARRLASDRRELDAVRRALAASDWPEAHAALGDTLRSRAVRFVLDPFDRPRLTASIVDRFPSAREHATARADKILRGRYDLLGYTDLSFRTSHGDVDWHADPVHGRRAPLVFWRRVAFLDPKSGDHKIIWELNRHQHWLALGRAAWLSGEARYSGAIVRELHGWLEANPPLTGINWASMLELAFRCLSWIWALHFLLGMDEPPGDGQPPWLVPLLSGLDRQLEHISRHLSVYFSPNTHLLGEALALYVGGRVLPELAAAARWEQLGRDVLLDQIGSQVLPDGGHVERSLHYHRYALDFYLLALSVARRTSDPAEPQFAEAVSRLAWFCRSMSDENGRLARIGDDDGGSLFPICGRDVADASDSLALAAALLGRPELATGNAPEETFWMLGADAAALSAPADTTIPSQLFAESGYAVLRRPDSQTIVDVGRHGFLNCGHAHADALSMVISAGGTPLLVDPGTASYTMNPEVRDRFRSTAMHNTLTIDGRPQSVPEGPFHWRTRTDARVDRWRVNRAFEYVEACHEGYHPIVHRRAVFAAGEGLWIVADHVLAEGNHRAEVHWHLDPTWEAGEDGTFRTRSGSRRGLRACVASTAGQPEIFLGDPTGLGFVSPIYGRVMPAVTLRSTAELQGRTTVMSAIAAGATPPGLHIEPVEILEPLEGWHVAAAAIWWQQQRLLAVFTTPAPASAPRAPSSYRLEFDGSVFESDARVAVLRFESSGEPFSASFVDVSRLTSLGPFPLVISLPVPAEDLHLDLPALRRLSRREAVSIESTSRLG